MAVAWQFSSHIHLAQITSFEDTDGEKNPPQLVVGNSGTQFVAPTEPLYEFGNATLGLYPVLEVKDTYNMYQYGFVSITKKKVQGAPAKSDAWELDFKDQEGRPMVECSLGLKEVSCMDLADQLDMPKYEDTDGTPPNGNPSYGNSCAAKKKEKKCKSPCAWTGSECVLSNQVGASLKSNVAAAEPIAEDNASAFVGSSVKIYSGLVLAMPLLLLW